MDVEPFKLKSFFSRHLRPSSLFGLSFSDAENWKWQEIIDLADSESRGLWEKAMSSKVPVSGLLQEEIARQYSGIDFKGIATFGGAQEAGYHIMRTLLNQGDHVIVITPCYQFLKEIPKMCGADVELLPLKREANFHLDMHTLKKAIRPKTRLLVLNYPHNPTGKLLTTDELREIVDLARFHGIYVLNDEVYKGLELDHKNSILPICSAYEKGIVITSLSKPFGLPTLRIGWAASKCYPILEKATLYRNYTSSRNSELSELMALMIVRNKKKLLARNLEIILKNVKILKEFFARHTKSLSWVPPEGGTMAFPKLLLPIPIDQFVEELYKETNVVLIPGSTFDVQENALRIAFGKTMLQDSLSPFESFLSKKEQKTSLTH
jgi:aspartate/methionine/tyrosine aminotransferase